MFWLLASAKPVSAWLSQNGRFGGAGHTKTPLEKSSLFGVVY